MAERSKYFGYYIAFSIGGLVVLALMCLLCCGGCVPWSDQQHAPDAVEHAE